MRTARDSHVPPSCVLFRAGNSSCRCAGRIRAEGLRPCLSGGDTEHSARPGGTRRRLPRLSAWGWLGEAIMSNRDQDQRNTQNQNPNQNEKGREGQGKDKGQQQQAQMPGQKGGQQQGGQRNENQRDERRDQR
ncbi:hypothetical protein Xaut_0188 [Xanthobacter versatilis]|uniref:Uncharacterized protein n=2 Tax=Xanthobacter autotrophicus (strain ATCC BAA-1158 / Py2) TaxID=78245 RepID=A7IBQ4_XANP2|nr:hypothetical protein Xaut_0188 [Xanthobacter autotrophicus Py2]